MCGCKRSFGTFAVPLSPYKGGCYDVEPLTQDAELEAEEADFEDYTIDELVAAGSEMAEITASISDLTNELHPIFRDDNICACSYKESLYCCSPYFVANPDQIADGKKATVTTSPDPGQNVVVRTILQLATKFLTHEATLPLWAGIIDCGRGPRQDVSRFYVHPRKRLNEAREADTLDQLNRFADNIRIHFVSLDADDHDGTSDAFAKVIKVCDNDPEFDPATEVVLTCHHTTIQQCNCPKGPIYAYRNGKPVIEQSGSYEFHHVFLNTKKITGFDQSSDQWRGMTIWELKTAIFDCASIVCHELTHAFMRFHCQREGFMNEECSLETGFAWENFTFGGLIHRDDSDPTTVIVLPWPNMQYFNHYMQGGHPMAIRSFGKLAWARTLIVDPQRYTRFLTQSFWDEETPGEDFKKMWLKPYYEAPTCEEEYTLFNSGHEPPVEILAKKQRLSDTATDRQRAYASRARRSEAMARMDRRQRCKERSLERREDFHDREKYRLNLLWANCAPKTYDKMFRGWVRSREADQDSILERRNAQIRLQPATVVYKDVSAQLRVPRTHHNVVCTVFMHSD